MDTRLLSVDKIDNTNAASFRYMTKMYFQKDNIFKHIVKRISRFMINLKIKSIAKKLVKIGYANTMSGNYIIGFEEAAKYTNTSLEFIEIYQNDIAAHIDSNKKILSETWLYENAFNMNFCCDWGE